MSQLNLLWMHLTLVCCSVLYLQVNTVKSARCISVSTSFTHESCEIILNQQIVKTDKDSWNNTFTLTTELHLFYSLLTPTISAGGRTNVNDQISYQPCFADFNSTWEQTGTGGHVELHLCNCDKVIFRRNAGQSLQNSKTTCVQQLSIWKLMEVLLCDVCK